MDLDDCQMITIGDAKKLVKEAIDAFRQELLDNLSLDTDSYYDEVTVKLTYEGKPFGWKASFLTGRD